MKYFPLIIPLAFIFGCTFNRQADRLPILGNHDISGEDTVYHHIPDFTFVNQDSQMVNNATFAGKIYVADFFFTSCPTICPKMTKQMLRIHDKYRDNDKVLLLSHTIDTQRDSVPRLKNYAKNLGVTSDKWHFVTGEKVAIYDIAEEYLSLASEDPNAPGGFDHSGWLLLIDGQRHIRSFCNGTNAEDVDVFMKDIDLLLSSEPTWPLNLTGNQLPASCLLEVFIAKSPFQGIFIPIHKELSSR